MRTPNRILPLALSALLCASAALAASPAANRSPAPGTYVTIPDTIVAGPGLKADVERGLFFVRENRAKADSRIIAVAFIRFPAQQTGGAGRPPVFLLAGGPGSDFDFKDPVEMRAAQRLSRTRDLVYISQRGNPIAPGLVAQMYTPSRTAPLDKPATVESVRESQRAAFKEALDQWTARGVDPSGYDILNIVDDVHELRAALGYDRIVLRGCSFGSQWSLSYLKRWPETVDRALLSGVEPLDYAYDSPKWLWSSLSRLAGRAEADAVLAKDIPEGGLMSAFRAVIERLEHRAQTVTIRAPDTGAAVPVTVGADDVRALIARLVSGKTIREGLGNWPRFILEMYRGDFRFVAAKAWEARRAEGSGVPLIFLLIDNSLGISAGRDSRLIAEPEARWLGDVNAIYHDTRDLTPTPDAGDAFRADWPIEVPVLLVNGDLDWSTPIENARHLRGFLKHGHLVEVRDGTHCGELTTMAQERPEQLEQINSFIDADFDRTTPERFFAKLPRTVAYAPLRFAPLSGTTLYDEWLQQSANRVMKRMNP